MEEGSNAMYATRKEKLSDLIEDDDDVVFPWDRDEKDDDVEESGVSLKERKVKLFILSPPDSVIFKDLRLDLRSCRKFQYQKRLLDEEEREGEGEGNLGRK